MIESTATLATYQEPLHQARAAHVTGYYQQYFSLFFLSHLSQ